MLLILFVHNILLMNELIFIQFAMAITGRHSRNLRTNVTVVHSSQGSLACSLSTQSVNFAVKSVMNIIASGSRWLTNILFELTE